MKKLIQKFKLNCKEHIVHGLGGFTPVLYFFGDEFFYILNFNINRYLILDFSEYVVFTETNISFEERRRNDETCVFPLSCLFVNFSNDINKFNVYKFNNDSVLKL